MYPVLDVLAELQQSLAHHPVVILQAPPGAGKSTVLPLHLLGSPWLGNQKIILLEPRRLAARSVAARLAAQRNESTGQTIGYRVRFESSVSAATRLEVVTEGILTRQLQQDNLLEGIGLVVFDEFHERSLNADLSLALCLQLQQLLRPDLKLLIMSATLDTEVLASRLGNAPVVTSKGKFFTVDFVYDPPSSTEPLPAVAARAVSRALREQVGDLLVFLPGVGEINRTEELLASTAAPVSKLYGDMPLSEQQEVLRPRADGLRKVVLATSVAETSLTIEGIRVVIDTGFSRVPRFDPRSGLTRLETVRVTKDAADQRAGRAGRTAPGVCYRLWPQHLALVPQRKPEILEADLASLVLELAQWGVRDIYELTWMTPPPAGAVQQAVELLHQLEALEGNRITLRGRAMLQLPTHPRLAHMLVWARENKQAALAADVAAVLEERDPLPRGSGADLALRVEVLRQWRDQQRVAAERSVLERVERLSSQWRKMLGVKAENTMPSFGAVGNLLMQAYPERIAQQTKKMSERYKLANGRQALLPAGDALAVADWLCAAQLDAGTGEGKIFLAAAVAREDLDERAEETYALRWDDAREVVTATVEKRIGTVVLQSRPASVTDEAAKNTILIEEINTRGWNWAGWGDGERQWQARVMSLKQWRPNESWPEVTDAALAASAHTWLTPFLLGLTKRSDLQKINWLTVLTTLLPYDFQSRLATCAPEKMMVPSGSWIKLQYFETGQTPVLEVRLQELFGLRDTPAINEGRTAVMLHLLSPGYKPVQVTQDLRSFWNSTYHEVRSELRRRYPRHSWPDDPWTAEAVRGAKRRG
ncbi:MAG: ATP-dependent helicase HrpB [Cyclobacteriaceae bacterium]|jgi:ATP-dependent helicase HrpB|nr:ATP-dependent helicase HrpB [Cyclobacteriaceae bacterium]